MGKALRFGSLGAALVFVPLAAAAVFVSGMSDCVACDTSPFLVEALLMSALYALLFGLVAGSAGATLKPRLDERLRPAAATIVLVSTVALLAIPTLAYAPRIYSYVEYLRTPRSQLPPGDPRYRPSDCSRRTQPNVVCAH